MELYGLNLLFFYCNSIKNKRKKKIFFFLSSAIFTSILLIDDFFMFHDYLLYFESFRVAPIITYSIYALLLFWYIINFYKIILESRYIFLILASVFLGLSVIIDLMFDSKGLQYFIEDGFKFLGITNWMFFFSISAYQNIMTKINIISD